jgi:signal transduction histidine kinase
MTLRTMIRDSTAAALAVGPTLALKVLIEGRVAPGPPLLIYLPAVTFGAWLGGLGPGLAATAPAAMVCAYAHLPPIGMLWLSVPNDRFRLAVFLVEGALLSVLMEGLHASRRRAEANAREAGRYQEELGRREGQLRAVRDHSPSVIFVKDRAGCYLLVNRRIEWANRALSGLGGAASVLAIGQDITALEEAQQRALQAERLAAIGEMVAGMSHESRNALHRSQVCLEMLGLEVEDRPEALNLIARLQAAQDDLYPLFEDVRSYAAPVHLDVRACDLADVWREAWAQLAAPRRGREDVLIEAVDGVDLHCAADPFRLGQVFRNILDNALSAVADPARIEIACDPAELEGQPALRVAVRDQGPGLSPEQRRRIFEPFFTTKTKGTALGMAISRRIVEAHGGRIAVGEGGGPGAEIIITLPRGLP